MTDHAPQPPPRCKPHSVPDCYICRSNPNKLADDRIAALREQLATSEARLADLQGKLDEAVFLANANQSNADGWQKAAEGAETRLAMAVEAASKIKHWHCWGKQSEGMVVSSAAVHGLWDALRATNKAVAAYRQRLRDEGAAEELKRISKTSIHTITLHPDMYGPGKDHRLVLCEALEARAEELRRQP